jgi:hypothetical protein
MPAEKMSKGRNFSSLAFILAFAFLFLSLMAILIVSGLAMYFSFQKQLENLAVQQNLVAQNAAYEVRGFVDGEFNSLETAASLSSIYGRGQAEQEEILNKMLGREPSIRQMILMDENGTEFAEVSRPSKSASRKLDENAVEDLFSRTRRMERFMSPVYIDDVTS